MKKLGKLTLKEMELEMPLLNDSQMDKLVAGSGGIDDNDCFFEALTYLGVLLDCNNYGYNGWISQYGQTYGTEAQIDAITNGVNSTTAIDFLDNYFLVNQVYDFNDLSSEKYLGFISTGFVTYFDPDRNAFDVTYPSEFIAAYSVDCY